MTCPDPILGSVSGASGSIGGVSYADLADAAAQQQGVTGQWQWPVFLTSAPGFVTRYRANQVLRDEHRVWPAVVASVEGGADPFTTECPPPPCSPEAPLTLTLDTTGGGSQYAVHLNGCVYELNGNSDRWPRCRQTAQGPTSGTATFTRWDYTVVEGSFDFQFGSERVQASFVAPCYTMDGCPPRPSKTTCLG